MLPVQTVMIRYMVLVYRWGRGWLGAAGDWEGFVGGAMRGGCARRWAVATRVRVRKGPADEGPAGPFRGEYYSVLSSSASSDSSTGSAGSLSVYFLSVSFQESGSNNLVPTGILNFLPLSSAFPSLIL